MTATAACREIRLELGVYLVGALGAAGRKAVGAHLACCRDCRDQLVELAGLPGLLRRVASDDMDCLVLHHDDDPGSGRDEPADLTVRYRPARAARIRRQRVGPRAAVAAGVGLIAGARAAAAKKTSPDLTRRVRRGRQGGDPAS